MTEKKQLEPMDITPEQFGYDRNLRMFAGFAKQILKPIQRDAAKLKDQKVMKLTDFANFNLNIPFVNNKDFMEYQAISAELKAPPSNIVEYVYFLQCHIESEILNSKLKYSDKSIKALDLMSLLLRAFGVFCHLKNSSNKSLYVIASYGLLINELTQTLAWGIRSKKSKVKERESFLDEMKLLIKECGGLVLPACREYYSRHEAAEKKKFLKKHQPTRNWENRCREKRTKSISTEYYELIKGTIKKK